MVVINMWYMWQQVNQWFCCLSNCWIFFLVWILICASHSECRAVLLYIEVWPVLPHSLPFTCHICAGLANLGACFHSLNELWEKHLHHWLIHWSGIAVSFLYSFLCNSSGHSQPALFCELSGYITFSHLWASLHCKGLLVSHSISHLCDAILQILLPDFLMLIIS